MTAVKKALLLSIKVRGWSKVCKFTHVKYFLHNKHMNELSKYYFI